MHHNLAKTLLVALNIALACALVDNASAAEAGLNKSLKANIKKPGSVPNFATQFWQNAVDSDEKDAEEAFDVAFYFPSEEANDHLEARLKALRDPSIAYNLLVSNPSNELEFVGLSVEFSVSPFVENTVWAELTVELTDTGGDGEAFLTGNFGNAGNIQGVTVRNSTTFENEFVGSPMGSDITSAGIYSFTLDPMAGPMLEGGDELSLNLFFFLSPGDTAHITSQFIIDEGTGIPFAEIPDLPDPADGPFFNVINVDSPEYSLGDDWLIGPQTQLNLSDGGSIGERFNFGQFMNNQLNDNSFDIEINVTGGTVGHQFMSLGGTTVNISGGTFEGNFLAGSYTGQSTDVEVNISGGTVGAGSAGQLQAYAGSVVNISGGTIGTRLAVNGGTVNVAGGEFGNTEFPSLVGTLQVNSGTLNIAGGSFFEEASQGVVTVLDGTANIAGGEFLEDAHDVNVHGSGELNLSGTEFLIDGAEIAGLIYGQPFEITDRDVTFSGVLFDGSAFSIDLNSTDETGFPAPDFVSPDALLTVTLGIPGDYNNDGIVNAADYVVWRNSEGTDAILPNDTSPGFVTEHDYDAWVANFGATAGGGAASDSPVPEPTSVLLFVLSLAAVTPRNGRRRTASIAQHAALT